MSARDGTFGDARSRWTALALLPCVVAGLLVHDPARMALLALTAAGVMTATSFACARLSRRPAMPGAVVAGVVFALTLPGHASLPAVAVAAAFGVVVGREIFGRPDRTFVHPAVIAHVFLIQAWPDGAAAAWLPAHESVSSFLSTPLLEGAPLGASSTAACVLGAAILVARGLVSWRVLVAIPVGVAIGGGLMSSAATTAAASVPVLDHLLLGGLVFGAVFAGAEPATSPATTSGQWFHGAAIGVLVILFRVANPQSPEGTMQAILLASVFAPLADHVVRASGRRFGRRAHG